MIDRRLFNAVIAVVTGMWVLNLAVAWFVSWYQPSPAINGIFTLIVGGAMTGYRWPQKKSADDDKS